MSRQANAAKDFGSGLGLRERQKNQRRQRMIDVAADLFNKHGYEAVTIEDIASRADLSPATVHNYYKGKARLLLAIVEQGDTRLIAQLHAIAGQPHDDAADAIDAVLYTITVGSLDYLAPKVWRHAIAASIIREDQAYGAGFANVHGQFTEALTVVLRGLQKSGMLPVGVNIETMASILYRMQHSLFVDLIGEEDPDLELHRAAIKMHAQLLLDAFAR